MPFNAPTCGAEPDTQDTGIVIYLDHGNADCADRDQRPYVGIVSDYNATGHPIPIDLLSNLCDDEKPTKTNALTFGKQAQRWPAMCRDNAKNGFIFRRLARQNAPRAKGDTPSINYYAYLNTQSSDMSANMNAFLSILKTVRFFPGTTKD